jgi:hypothetical protein
MRARAEALDTHLGIDSHILEEPGNAAKTLVEMMAFSQRMRYRLKNLLILFGVGLVYFLHGADIIFQVYDSMFPCLESFRKQAGGLDYSQTRLANRSRKDVSGQMDRRSRW